MKKPSAQGVAISKSNCAESKSFPVSSETFTSSESSKVYVLEYSGSQQCYHIEDLESMVEANMRAFLQGRLSDFMVIAIASDINRLDRLIEKIREGRL